VIVPQVSTTTVRGRAAATAQDYYQELAAKALSVREGRISTMPKPIIKERAGFARRALRKQRLAASEHFRAKWIPVRVKKMRQNKEQRIFAIRRSAEIL